MKFPEQSLPNWFFMLFVLFEHFLLIENYNCKVTTIDNTLRADCKGYNSRTPEKGIPKDLDKNIQYLDMSNNIVEELSTASFDIYPNLLWLSMTFSKLAFDIKHHMLSPLLKLEYFNVSHVSWIDNPNWAWPPNVKIIDASSFQIKNIDVSICKHLEVFNVSNNSLTDIPVMNQLAPLKIVNISANPMSSLTAEKLAKYCNLQYLSMSFKSNSELFRPEKYCDCVRINKWTETYNIIVPEKLPCSHPSGDINCDTAFSEEILRERQECFDLITPFKFNWKFILIGGGAVLLLLLIFLFLAYKYGSLQKKLATGELEIVDDISRNKTRSPLKSIIEEIEEEPEEENA